MIVANSAITGCTFIGLGVHFSKALLLYARHGYNQEVQVLYTPGRRKY